MADTGCTINCDCTYQVEAVIKAVIKAAAEDEAKAKAKAAEAEAEAAEAEAAEAAAAEAAEEEEDGEEEASVGYIEAAWVPILADIYPGTTPTRLRPKGMQQAVAARAAVFPRYPGGAKAPAQRAPLDESRRTRCHSSRCRL